MMVSIAPCHDKKLETFRPESHVEEVSVGAEGVKSLDVVLTTSEILDLLREEPQEQIHSICYSGEKLISDVLQGVHLQSGYFESFSVSGYTPREHPIFLPSKFAALNSSNNFLSQLFLRQIYKATGRLPEESTLKESLRRNKKGFVEVGLEDAESGIKLSGARVYGFKNIQNMIRNLKSSAGGNPYQYVEVLACPGGCYSGGGQTKEKDTNPAATEKSFEVLHNIRNLDEAAAATNSSKMVDEADEQAHNAASAPTYRRYFFQNPLACELAEQILAGKCRWIRREDLEYQIRSLNTDNPLAMKW